VRGLLASVAVLLATAAYAGTPIPDQSTQLVLVITRDWDANQGTLQTFRRESGQWVATKESFSISLGRAGSAWGVGLHDAQPGPQKREGDGRSPAGAFAIGPAFGYAERASFGIPYRAMTEFDFCIDVNDSPLYNRIVDARSVGREAVAQSTEPMRRDIHANGDVRYQLGFVIQHNPRNVSGQGSCIFAHLWGAPGQTTAGCTAMDEDAMRDLLGWLDDSAEPVFVLLPIDEYRRVAAAWGLPLGVEGTK
jgi:L,D-peptidoglycan transpeptidase YkuD (ErfK/YbiS/YcfS/YnhG family)